MEGFCGDGTTRRTSRGGPGMAGWVAQGKLKSKEDIVEGLETFLETLMKPFNGENFGKLVPKSAETQVQMGACL